MDVSPSTQTCCNTEFLSPNYVLISYQASVGMYYVMKQFSTQKLKLKTTDYEINIFFKVPLPFRDKEFPSAYSICFPFRAFRYCFTLESIVSFSSMQTSWKKKFLRVGMYVFYRDINYFRSGRKQLFFLLLISFQCFPKVEVQKIVFGVFIQNVHYN